MVIILLSLLLQILITFFDDENGIFNLGKSYDDWIKEDPERAKYDSYLVQANYSKKGNIRSNRKGPVNKYKYFNLRNGGNDSEFAKMRDNVIQELVSGNPYFETQQ